jgi:carbamoyltransferase
MKIVGLYNAHDGGYSILEDGKIVEHTEFERYTRLKESGGHSLDLYLKNYKSIEGVDQFVSVSPNTNLERAGGNDYDTFSKISKDDVKFFSHHLCHASHAYFSSPYNDSIIISVDNAGMEETGIGLSCAIYFASENKIEKVYDIKSEDFSLGDLWGRMTRWVFKLSTGFPRGHQAGSVMAMAALGNPEKYSSDLSRMMNEDHKRAVATPFGSKRGVYVPPEEEVIHPYLDKYRKIAEDEQERFNLAASLQKETESFYNQVIEIAFAIAENKNFNSKNICFSGGCCLNSVTMGKMWSLYGPKGYNLFVPPVPYDGGLNIGATQYYYHHVLGNKKYYNETNFSSPYLGEIYSEDEIKDIVKKEVDKKSIKLSEGYSVKDIASLLAEGKIISVFNGRSESGRRALGNRSILANPAIPDMKSIINERVKHRQWYRPFAPSILEEHGSEWFENFFPSPYMGFVFNIKKEMIGKVKAIEHFDGSARVQSVNKNQNLWYYSLIKEFYKITNIPILLNTSFNDQEPIVETPYDAIKCFLGTDIDFLYFADTKQILYK